MNTLEKIEFITKHKEVLNQIFNENVIEGMLLSLWDEQNKIENDMDSDRKETMSQEEMDFVRNVAFGLVPKGNYNV